MNIDRARITPATATTIKLKCRYEGGASMSFICRTFSSCHSIRRSDISMVSQMSTKWENTHNKYSSGVAAAGVTIKKYAKHISFCLPFSFRNKTIYFRCVQESVGLKTPDKNRYLLKVIKKRVLPYIQWEQYILEMCFHSLNNGQGENAWRLASDGEREREK